MALLQKAYKSTLKHIEKHPDKMMTLLKKFPHQTVTMINKNKKQAIAMLTAYKAEMIGLLLHKPAHTMELLSANSKSTVAMVLAKHAGDTTEFMVKHKDRVQVLLEKHPTSGLRIIVDNAEDAMGLLLEHDSILSTSTAAAADPDSAEVAEFHLLRNCELCGYTFGRVVHRRHHCRVCGKSVCGKCGPKRASKGGVRVCKVCFDDSDAKAKVEEVAEDSSESDSTLEGSDGDAL